MVPRSRFRQPEPRSPAGRDDNPIPTRFLVPIDCYKIPALVAFTGAELCSGTTKSVNTVEAQGVAAANFSMRSELLLYRDFAIVRELESCL